MRLAAIPEIRATHLRNLAVFAGAWLLALVVVAIVFVARPGGPDAVQYWLTWHGNPYAQVLYPPPALLLFVPAAFLPQSWFVALWTGLLVAAATWLVWPLPARLRLPVWIALAATTGWGNVAMLLAVAVALAPRFPLTWGLVGWVKITPAVAAVSLVRQRRWRAIASIAVPSAVLAVALLVLVPDTVGGWLRALTVGGPVVGDNFMRSWLPVTIPVAVRVPIAAAIAWWYGSSRPWTLAVAALLATPDVSLATCGMLAAVPRLVMSR